MTGASSAATSPASSPAAAEDPRDVFLDEAAHQLRTPLTPLLMLAHLMRDDATLPESLREQLGMLRENVELAATVIDEFTDVGRMRRGRLRIAPDEVELRPMIDAAAAAAGVEGTARRVRVSAACDPLRLHADPQRLRRLIDCLLHNAVQHSAVGSEVTIAARARDGWCQITVADAGPGVPSELTRSLFDPFGEGRPRSRTARLLGAGLAIGRAVAELHGGALTVHRSPAGGALFALRLPLRVPSQRLGTV